MLTRSLVLSLVFMLTLSGSAGATLQTPTADLDRVVDDHLAWVLSLFDGAASDLTEDEVETRFDRTFLSLVPPQEVIATMQQLATTLGPLALVEDQSENPGEFIGTFEAESGERVLISFAVDPQSGLMAGFFITPADAPVPAGSPIATPMATPAASPVAAASPVVDDPAAQISLYEDRQAAIRAVGAPVVEAVLAGDNEALEPYLSPQMVAALESTSLSDVIDTYTTRQVQMVFAEAGASFFGQWTDDEISGVMIQGGLPYPFVLVAEEPQTGELPAGRWSGSIPRAQLEITVEFATEGDGSLAATLDIPAQRVVDQSLSDVRYLQDRPVGVQVTERAFAPGELNNSYTVDRAWGDHLLRITVAVDIETGLAQGIQVLPAIPLPPAESPAPQATYHLPLEGTWWVFWGGETQLQNYHAATPSQRYAYDLVIWKDGATYSGDGTANDDYWAWGQAVFAPADGVVVDAVSTAEDLPPNAPLDVRTRSGNPGGNYVVLQTAEAEYVMIAHMQRGSVRVEPGDEVKAGDLLGLTGNSGNSSEPHIHIHVQDTPEMLDIGASGIPLRFETAVVNGEPQQGVLPEQGSFVAPE